MARAAQRVDPGSMEARMAAVPRHLPAVVLDAAAVVASTAVAHALLGSPLSRRTLLTGMVLAVTAFVGLNLGTGSYGSVWRHASITEARRLLLVGLLVTAALATVAVARGPAAVSVAVLAGGTATMLMGVVRFQNRLFSYQRQHDHAAPSAQRVVVLGAGRAGAGLVRQMLDDPRHPLVPVALLDDDPRLWGRRVHDVPVLGPVDELSRVCRDRRADQVLLSVPLTPPGRLQSLADAAEETGAALRVLPGLGDMVAGVARLEDVRDVRIEDLLGREPVVADAGAVEALVRGRTVLVTGAGGSIGSEIVRQLARLHPGRLVLVDRDETLLHDISLEIGCPLRLALLDIRDGDPLKRLLLDETPSIVFHAAANKHVPLLESHPVEAVTTNVLGTRNLLAACEAAGVRTLVSISTDKAVRPSSVMGATKRVAEHLVVDAARRTGRPWAAVRFGNVLGSRGSVVPIFTQQIRSGGPVTVTHPEMNRFFMTIPEAVGLVLQSATMARGGEIFMLDMGDPVRIVDLARRMIRLSGRRVGTDVELLFTGPRPGEKLTEQLCRPDESPRPTAHAGITALVPVTPPQASLEEAVDLLSTLTRLRDEVELRQHLMRLVAREDDWPGRVQETPVAGPAVPVQAGKEGTVWNRSTT